MTTGLQLALLAGGLLGLGVTLIVLRLLPAQPDLADALDRIGANPRATLTATPTTSDGKERLGLWALRMLPAGLWARTPTRELALLRIPLARFYGEKLTFAALGLVLPPLLTFFFHLIGIGLPFAVPTIA